MCFRMAFGSWFELWQYAWLMTLSYVAWVARTSQNHCYYYYCSGPGAGLSALAVKCQCTEGNTNKNKSQQKEAK